jgi:hypothetical protein
MTTVDLLVEFPEHTPASRIESLVTGIAAYGNVTEEGRPRTFKVSVFRAAKLPRLEKQLETWEQYGYLRWRRIVESGDM